MHRDLYGDLVFPLQVVINLSEPGVDHTGGEFLLVEQRPRAQSRGTSNLIPRGSGLIFTTRDRPVQSARGWSSAPYATASPLSAPEDGSPSGWSFTMPAETHRAPYTLVGTDGDTHASGRPGTLGGHGAGQIYGRLDCRAAVRLLANGGYAADRVFFADETTAVAAGYRPCAVCLPERYAIWKDLRDARSDAEAGPIPLRVAYAASRRLLDRCVSHFGPLHQLESLVISHSLDQIARDAAQLFFHPPRRPRRRGAGSRELA